MRFPRPLEQKGAAAPAVSDRRSKPRAKIQYKSGITFDIKAVDEKAHTFTGLAAAFSLDAGGDVIRKGAFVRTLDHWRAQKKQRPIHLVDMHGYDSVLRVVGMMTEGEETADGLLSTFGMVPDDPGAEAAFRRVKGGFITGLSIGYEAVRVTYPNDEERKRGIWRFLDEVKLREISLVIWGMNEDALIDTETAKAHVDAMLARGGKALSEDERAQLVQMRDQLDALLSASEPAEEEPGESDGKGLAANDPKRLELESITRELMLRTIATA